MSYNLFVLGKITKNTKGEHHIHTDGDKSINAKKIKLNSTDGIKYGDNPKDPPKFRLEPSHFMACIFFYRSKAQANGNYGNKDTEYNGEFGFDTFDKKVCAEGTYSNYDTINSAIPAVETVKGIKSHLTSYASIYPPNVEGDSNNKKSKITLYVLAKEDEKKKKETHDVQFISSNPNAIKIVGNNTLTMTVGDTNPQPLTIECIAPFDTDVEIKALGINEAFPIGRLIIKANATRYKTILQPVEVVFANQENFNIQTVPNDQMFEDLEKKFDNNSFNQAYIQGKLAPNTKKIVVNKKDYLDKGYLFELNNLLYVKKEKNNDESTKRFNEQIESKYTHVLNNMGAGDPAEMKVKLNEQEIKLLETFGKKFNYKISNDVVYGEKKHQEKIATKAWNHPKVQTEYQKYVTLKQQYEQTGGILPLNKKDTLHLFYSKDIYGGGNNTTGQTDSNEQTVIDTVLAYSVSGSGVCYIFNAAFKSHDNITTILHELGHSLGLPHTFDESLPNYEKRVPNKRYKQDVEEEIKMLEKKLKHIDDPKPTQTGVHCQHLYNAIKNAIERNYTEEPFENNFINALLGNPKGALVAEQNNQFYLDANQEANTTPIETKEELKDKINELEKEKKSAESLDTYPNWKEQSQTLENYMDYYQKANSVEANPDFERKSFTNKQCSIMQQKGIEATTLKLM